MFGLGFQEMVVIAVLVLLFFPAEDLPGLMRSAGRWYAKIRRGSDELRRAFNAEVARAESEFRLEEVRVRREEQARARAEAEAAREQAAPEAPITTSETRVASEPVDEAAPSPEPPADSPPPVDDAPPTETAAPSRSAAADPRLRAYVPLDQRHDDEAPRVMPAPPATGTER